jgi:hypothetical protein
MTQNTVRKCYRQRPCNDFRRCERCARRRQRELADAAWRLEQARGPLSWTCLTPDQPGNRAIREIRDIYRQRCEAGAGLWTIERGNVTGGLHCNIIAPIHRAPVISGARAWVQPIIGSVRNVAAYIGKRSQIPSLAEYDGHTRGRWGPLSAWLTAPDTPAVVVADSIEQHLLHAWHATHGTIGAYAPDPTPGELASWASRAEPPPPESYAEIARRHLPTLLSLRAGLGARKCIK